MDDGAGHPGGDPRPALHPVLHHQGQGARPRAGPLPPHRRGAPRRHPGRERARQGHHRLLLPADRPMSATRSHDARHADDPDRGRRGQPALGPREGLPRARATRSPRSRTAPRPCGKSRRTLRPHPPRRPHARHRRPVAPEAGARQAPRRPGRDHDRARHHGDRGRGHAARAPTTTWPSPSTSTRRSCSPSAR